MKGADSVIKEMVKMEERIFIDEECKVLSQKGLRTLVFAFKELSEK